jgi:cytochrome P450
MPITNSTRALSVLDTSTFADPDAYADETRLHSALTHFRANKPVAFVDIAPYEPYWAITKHADIVAIERNNELFINAPRPMLVTAERDQQSRAEVAAGKGLQTLVHVDGAHHRKLRSVGANWFRPKAMRELQTRVDELATQYVDRMRDIGPVCDFVSDIAVGYPLYVIMSLLGVPESDYPFMLTMTQEIFGSDDEDHRRGDGVDDFAAVVAESFDYFRRLVASRRTRPTDDLLSAVANGRVEGELLSEMEAVSYAHIIATAGHDTTKHAISGGLRALIEHPEQFARLRRDPDRLMPSAVEEMIRWTTPVKEFMRTATGDTEVRGVPIAAGESVYLAYASGNRDEEVFDDPFQFDIGRTPNRHLAFGQGVHFCLGAPLARMEMIGLFKALVPRLESIEFSGEPELTSTVFVGGHKRLPVRYSLT